MTAMIRKLRLLPLGVLFVAATLFGCTQPGITGGGALSPRVTKVNTHTAASRLGLAVIHTSRTSATLRGGCNSVVMYSDPAGEVYVNGRSLPDSGGIRAENGTLLVPEKLVRRIGAVLRPGPGPGDTPPIRDPVVPPPVQPRLPKRIGRVVLDPGHGGKDPGATSSLGYYEKDLVLGVSKMVAAELTARGVEVIMTRTDDRFIELEDRPAVANRTRSDLFVSIHADAAANRSATGFTMYISRSPSRKSLAVANALLRRMCASCGTRSRGVKNADYRVLVHSRVPAVLVELGFLSNRVEARKLNTSAYQRTVARAVALGIYDALR